MSNALSPVLRTGGAPVAAVSSPNAAQFWIPDVWGKSFDDAMTAWAQIAAARRRRRRARPPPSPPRA